MSATGPHVPEENASDIRPRTISQYVTLLRDRWLAATVTFVLVVVAISAHGLFSAPVYASQAVIQIERERPGTDMLADLSFLEGQPSFEAELQVMRSFTVAVRAVDALGLTTQVLEKHGYRPWNMLLDSVQGSHTLCRLSATAADDVGPARNGTYELAFDAAGRRFTVRDSESDQELGRYPFSADGRASFAVADCDLELRTLQGSPAGRAFKMQLRTRASAANWVQDHSIAEQIGARTGVVHLGFQAESPHLAQRVAQGLSDSYREGKQLRKQERLDKRIIWLDDQTKRVEADLKTALNARGTYVVAHGALLLSEKARAAFEAQISLTEQRLVQQQLLNEQQAALDALLEIAEPANVLAVIGANRVDPKTSAIADRLAGLEISRGLLRRRKTPDVNPQVRRLEAEIAESREQLQARTTALRDEVAANLQRKIDAIQHRLGQIAEERARYDAQLGELPEEERQLAELTRDVAAHDRSLAFLVRMKGEAEIARESTLTSAYQVDPALLPEFRSSPVLFLHAVMAVALGLLAAFGAALVQHVRDHTIKSPRQLERGVGLPLFALIPAFSTIRRTDRRALTGPLVARDLPFSALAECYRALRANIRFTDPGHPIRTLTLTSALPQEGKTTTTLNLATVMAQAGNSVVVLDADFRRPTVHSSFKSARSPGLTEVLLEQAAWRETLVPTSVEGLQFIPAGSQAKDPGALIESAAFQSLLRDLQQEFEYVLIDVPPVLAVADAAPLYRTSDAVLLVSRSGVCEMELANAARSQIERFGGRLIGAVFNGFDLRRAERGQYGYAGPYGYGSYTDAEGSPHDVSGQRSGLEPSKRRSKRA